MNHTPQSNKSPSNSFTYEQMMPGDAMLRQVRAMVLTAEADREGVSPWIDAVIHEIADRQRIVFVARRLHALAGYMILKPRDHKISSIWVEKNFRGLGVGQKFYGIGFVNLGVSNPYTAFMPDMIEEMRPIARAYALVLDDLGAMCVINPDDHEPWAKPAPRKTETHTQTQTQEQATRLVRQRLSAYKS
jgi:hypothetical protein